MHAAPFPPIADARNLTNAGVACPDWAVHAKLMIPEFANCRCAEKSGYVETHLGVHESSNSGHINIMCHSFHVCSC